MTLVKPNLWAAGMVTPSGALSKPLIDYLSALYSSASTSWTVDLSALTDRVAALESAAPTTLHGTPHQIEVIAEAIRIAYDYPGQTSIVTLGTITTGAWNGSTIAAAYGGTGFSAYAIGDILAADALGTLSKIAAGTAGYALVANGAGVLPSWQQLVIDSIADTDATHAPSRNAVFDALALKADKSGGTFSGDISVPDEVYDATAWNGSLEVPTKNALRDKIESLSAGGITALTGDVTASGPGSVAATIAANAVTTTKINNAAVTLAKIANAAANSKLLGSGAAGSGAAYAELTLGANLTMSGTTLNAAGGGSGAMTYVGGAAIAGAAATVLTISGLDLNTDVRYYVEYSFKNATASTVQVDLFYNADTTATNYDSQVILASAASASGGRANNGRICDMLTGATGMGWIRILNDRDNCPSAIAESRYAATTNIRYIVSAHMWRTAGTNVTGITLSSSVASAFAIGSYIKIWKIT